MYRVNSVYTVLLFCCCLTAFSMMGQTVKFQVNYREQPFQLETSYPIPSTNNSISFSKFSFFVSKLQLITENGVLDYSDQYYLIDMANGSNQILLEQRDSAKVSEIRFTLGIDSATNVSGAMGGNLDPTNGMYWSWQSGYINVKLEGESSVLPTRKNKMQLHLGGYLSPFASAQELSLKVDKQEQIQIDFSLDQFLSQLNLQEQHTVMSPSEEAVHLMRLMSQFFKVNE